MRRNCAITASRVTLPADEEGVDVEGAEEARGVAVSIHDHFGRSWASLRLMIAVSMVHITKK